MPEETAEQIAAREAEEATAAEAAAGEGGEGGSGDGGSNEPDPVAEARAEAEQLRTAANEAQASATAEQATLARERSEFADQKLAFAEQQAKAGDKKFPESVVKGLREEAASHRTKLREREAEVQNLKDAAKTDIERLTGEARTFEQRAVEAEKKLLRVTVGTKKGLPADLHERLIGDTQEELEKDADKLLKTVTPAPAGLDQGSRGGGSRTAAGSSGGAAGGGKGEGKGAMNDFIRSHGGRRELPGQSGATGA